LRGTINSERCRDYSRIGRGNRSLPLSCCLKSSGSSPLIPLFFAKLSGARLLRRGNFVGGRRRFLRAAANVCTRRNVCRLTMAQLYEASNAAPSNAAYYTHCDFPRPARLPAGFALRGVASRPALHCSRYALRVRNARIVKRDSSRPQKRAFFKTAASENAPPYRRTFFPIDRSESTRDFASFSKRSLVPRRPSPLPSSPSPVLLFPGDNCA